MESDFSIQLKDVIGFAILIVTVVAIIVGPILAVWVSMSREDSRAASDRRQKIFADLMRTRLMYISPIHVDALNSVQVEFADNNAVIGAHKKYIEILNGPFPEPGPMLDSFLLRRTDLFYDLVHEIARVQGYALDKRDLERLAYVPVVWSNDENELRIFRRAMIELLHGNRALPVAAFQPAQDQNPSRNPYPPPP